MKSLGKNINFTFPIRTFATACTASIALIACGGADDSSPNEQVTITSVVFPLHPGEEVNFCQENCVPTSPDPIAPDIDSQPEAEIDLIPGTELTVIPLNSLDVRTFGAKGDGKHNDGPAITAAITAAIAASKAVYFPRGEYRIDESIELKSDAKMIGDKNHLALLRGSKAGIKIGSPDWSSRASHVQIRDLGFEDITLGFTGNSSQIIIEKNIFFGKIETEDPHVAIGSEVQNSVVRDNIFLRSRIGRGVTTYNAKSTIIDSNIFGLPDNMVYRNMLIRQLPAIHRILLKKASRKILESQGATFGCFKTGVNAYNNDVDLSITRNIFYGNLDEKNCVKDHVIYAKAATNMRITGNYIRGWLNDAGGGVKLKNGINVLISSNWFEDTGLLLHTYPGLKILGFDGLYVLDNFYRGYSNIGKWQSGFNLQVYANNTPWDDPIHTAKPQPGATNVVFSGNRFDVDIIGRNISLNNSDLRSVYAYDNLSIDNMPVRNVQLFGQFPLSSLGELSLPPKDQRGQLPNLVIPR